MDIPRREIQHERAAPRDLEFDAALLSRAGGTWQLQGQAVMPRALPWTPWALASDGNALFLGGAMFTRSGGAWPCP